MEEYAAGRIILAPGIQPLLNSLQDGARDPVVPLGIPPEGPGAKASGPQYKELNMNELLKSDAFTRIDMDRFTGQPLRKWIEYADGVVEPVRKAGNLNRKFHGNKRSLDWWTVNKPVDWNPLDEGRDVSLNHDYGKRSTPAEAGGKTGTGRTPKYIPERDHAEREPLPWRRGEKLRPEPMPWRRGEKLVPEPFAAAEEKKKNDAEPGSTDSSGTPAVPEAGGEKKETPRTTLLRGGEAYHDFEARRDAEKRSETPRPDFEDKDPRPDVHRGEAAEPSGSPVFRGQVNGRPEPAQTPGSPSGKPEEAHDAAASAGALGGMVQSKGQHGKGKLTSNDPKVQELIDKFGGKREDFKREANKELNALSDQAKKATSPKERNQLLRRKDAIKGAIKLMDRELLKMPLITPFSGDQLKQLIRGFDPYSPTT
jgi:hypothetical protein